MVNKKIKRAAAFAMMAVLLLASSVTAFAQAGAGIARIPEGVDLSSRRLLVASDEEMVKADQALVASYNGIHLLQYKTEQDAEEAYLYYQDIADFVEADSGIAAASAGNTEDEIIITDTVMTEEENPFTRLEELGEDAVTEPAEDSAEDADLEMPAYDIALIDTGADGADAQVSMIGDHAEDDNGHGTAMLKLIHEQNPDARVLSIKVLDKDGKGDLSAVFAGMSYAMVQNVKIINLSISALSTPDSTILEEAVKEAQSKGITVVGSAGNNGRDAGYYVPGSIKEALIVGSCDENGVRAESSNYGESVDYNICADSTSGAAALMSGWLSLNGAEAIEDAVGKGLIFSTLAEEPETTEETEETTPDSAGIMIKYLYADADRIGPDDTIGSIYQSDPDAILMQTQEYASVREEDGYFFFHADTPYREGLVVTDPVDYVFAEGNDGGNLISEGVWFDPASHTGKISRELVHTEAAKGDFADVQLQVLIPLSFDDLGAFYASGYSDGSNKPILADSNLKVGDLSNLGYVKFDFTDYSAGELIASKLKVNMYYYNAAADQGKADDYESSLWSYGKIDPPQTTNTSYNNVYDKDTAVGMCIPLTVAGQDFTFYSNAACTRTYLSTSKGIPSGYNPYIPCYCHHIEVPSSSWNSYSKIFTETTAKLRLIAKKTNNNGTVTALLAVETNEWEYEPQATGFVFQVTGSQSTGDLTIQKTVSKNNGSVKILKKLDGTGTNANDTFTFKATLSASGTYQKHDVDGTAIGSKTDIANNGTFTLKGGQYVILALPAGTTYSVKETADANYRTSTDTVSGTIPDATTKNFSFTVTLKDGSTNVSGTYGGLTFTKGKATFSLQANKSKSITGIPAGYSFTVTETEPTEAGWTISGNNATGTISAGKTVSKTITNTFKPNEKTARQTKTITNESGSFKLSKTIANSNGILVVKKVVHNGRASDHNKDFTFTLTADKNGMKYTKYNADDSVVLGFSDKAISSGGTFTLKNGQYVKISMPAGTSYKVTETDAKTSVNTTAGSKESLFTVEAQGTGVSKTETREVSGKFPEADPSQQFTFTVKIMDASGKAVSGLRTPYSGKIKGVNDSGAKTTGTDGTFTIRLIGGDSITFKEIPAGYKYTVTEEEVSGYSTTSSNASNVTVPVSTVPETKFTNTCELSDRTATFTNTTEETDTGIIKASVSTDTQKQLYDWAGDMTEYKDAHGVSKADYNHMYSENFLDTVFNVKVYDRNDNSVLTYEATVHPKIYEKDASGKWTASLDLTDTSTVIKTISGSIDKLLVGDKVVVTEITAPKGYLLPSVADPDASDSQTLKALSKTVSKNKVTFADTPAYDPFGISIFKQKMVYKNGKQTVTDEPVWDTVHYDQPMGPVFLVSYYDNDNCSGTPVRYWYFMTDEDGELIYEEDYLIGGGSGIRFKDSAFYDGSTLTAQIPDGYKWANKGALYSSADGLEDLPLGSVAIQEVWSPAGYELLKETATGKPVVFQKKICQASNGEAVAEWITDKSAFNSGIEGTAYVEDNSFIAGDAALILAIRKTDSSTKELVTGAEFTITDVQDRGKEYVYTTDAREEYHVVRDFLEIGHTYTLQETAFPDGYVLNEDVVTFYVDENGNLHFEDCKDRFGSHKVAPVTHKLETGKADGSAEEVTYTVKKAGSSSEDYEITYEEGIVNEKGKAGTNGDKCFILNIKDEPNVLELYKTDEHGNPLKGVQFTVYAESLPESDNTTVIAYRDESYKVPFKNGETLTTDENGKAYLYRLNTKVRMKSGKKLRDSETYIITETKTVDELSLLASRIPVSVSAKGRISGSMDREMDGKVYRYYGNETRNDGNIHYNLEVTDNVTVTLVTGGEGTTVIYVTAAVLLAGLAGGVFLIRKRKKETA